MSSINAIESVEVAICHLQNRAAIWMMQLEDKCEKRTTLSDLQDAMILEFVPVDEQANAKSKLFNIKVWKSAHGYTEEFKSLLDIAEVPNKMAYTFFCQGLPDIYKQELTKLYPRACAKDMRDVLQHKNPRTCL